MSIEKDRSFARDIDCALEKFDDFMNDFDCLYDPMFGVIPEVLLEELNGALYTYGYQIVKVRKQHGDSREENC